MIKEVLPLIYTVTFNPAIDYVIHTDKIKLGYVNRLNKEQIFFGGKGINVSIVLKELGIESKALGFIAGFTGDAIENGIKSMGIETDFVRLKDGFSRINVKIKSNSETDLNGQGPEISRDELEELFSKISLIKDGDTLVLAGSIPKSLPSNIYETILSRLSDKKIKTIVDAGGDLLLNVLKYQPFLIKPNKDELSELFGVTINDNEDVIKYAKKLKSMGAANVLVSLAGDGAILLDESGAIYTCRACKGNVINSVGAGDSMVAGFIAGCSVGGSEYALKLGTASGGATAFSGGLAKKEDIITLFNTL